MSFSVLLITFLFGAFLLLGTGIVFMAKNNNHFIKFSMGLAFSVMIMMAIFDLLPEILTIFNDHYSNLVALVLIFLYSLIGFGMLRIFDIFIPHHHDLKEDHHETVIAHDHFFHIGVISSVVLVLHNLIEGMALYQLLITSFSSGILFGLGVGLHNIPLGMMISSAFYQKNKSKKKTFLLVFSICIFTFLGGVFMGLTSDFIPEIVLGIFLCLTFGMVFYITFFELLSHILLKQDRMYSIWGIVVGIGIYFVLLFCH